MPVIIGAVIGGVMNGMQAEMNGGHFLDGAWKGAIVGAVGGALGQFGGGTFLNNVVWGAGTGAITGGLSAGLNNGDIGKGMLYGAAIGGTFAAATCGMEAYGNYKNGHGFRTNEGVINNYVKNNQYQNAIDYVQTKYGMTLNYQGQNVSMQYNANITDYGVTDPLTGNIEIGPAAFGSSSELKATIVHEFGHSVKDRVLDASGNFVNWQYPSGTFAPTNPTLSADGPLGYSNEIFNAGRLHIKPQYLKPTYNPLWSIWDKYWFYLIPNRFTTPVTLRWY